MSYSTFPALQGLTWGQPKRSTWNTSKETTAAGNEYRTSFQQYPITEFDLIYSYLNSSDKLTMEGFFNQQQGALSPFFFDATNDDTIASPFAFGVTVNPGTVYPLMKPSGTGASEPVGGVNPSGFVFYVDGVLQPFLGIGTPANPVLSSVAGGSLAATTYYVKITWQNAWGITVGSAEVSLAVAANHLLVVTAPSAPASAIWWNVYVSTSTGNENLQTSGTLLSVATASWTEPTGGLAGSGSVPSSDGTFWQLTGNPNQITLPSQPYAGHTLSWTGNYYYLMRFKEDELEFNQFANLMYEIKQLTLRVVW